MEQGVPPSHRKLSLEVELSCIFKDIWSLYFCEQEWGYFSPSGL